MKRKRTPRKFNQQLIGSRFGRLLVKARIEKSKDGATQWYCICDCGRASIQTTSRLNSGNSRSCGCQIAAVARRLWTKTGACKDGKRTPTYRSWVSLKTRCFNPKEPGYERYGGRGITVTKRWLGKRGFEHFLSDMGERPPGTSIDRINGNGNYNKRNCRWATRAEQSANTSTAKLTFAKVIDIRRRLQTSESIKAIAARFKVSPNRIYLIRSNGAWKQAA